MNTDLAWDQNILSEEDAVNCVHCLIDRDMVRDFANLMKNGKASESLG